MCRASARARTHAGPGGGTGTASGCDACNGNGRWRWGGLERGGNQGGKGKGSAFLSLRDINAAGAEKRSARKHCSKPCRNGNNTRHDPVGPTAPGRAQGPARHHRPQSRHIDTSGWRILRVAARHGVGLARIVVELAHGTLDAVQFNPVHSSGSHVSEAWVRVRRNSSMEAQAEESRWRQLTCQGFSAMRARQ